MFIHLVLFSLIFNNYFSLLFNDFHYFVLISNCFCINHHSYFDVCVLILLDFQWFILLFQPFLRCSWVFTGSHGFPMFCFAFDWFRFIFEMIWICFFSIFLWLIVIACHWLVLLILFESHRFSVLSFAFQWFSYVLL